MFKLLKFVDEYKEFVYEASGFSPSNLYSALKSIFTERKFSQHISVLENALLLVTKLASVFYYLLDNAVWFFNVGVVSKQIVTKSYWKKKKDIFNLVRNWAQIFRSMILVFKAQNELAKIENELKQYSTRVVGTTCLKATELVRKYINQKQKMYDHMFVFVRNIMRVMMLNYKLKISPWINIFHPIVVTVFGIVQNITALFKIWMKQKHTNYDNRMIRMQDFIRLMPRMEELAQQAAQASHDKP